MPQVKQNTKSSSSRWASPGLRPSNCWGVILAVAQSCRLGIWKGMPLTGLLMGTLSIALPTLPAQAAELTSWQFDPATHQLQVNVPQGTTPRYFLLAQPARIVIDLPNTQMGAVPTEQTYAGAVRQIRVAQFEAGLTRIVMELSPDAVLAPGQVELQSASGQTSTTDQAQWLLRPLLTEESAGIAANQDSIAAQPIPDSNSAPMGEARSQTIAPSPTASTPPAIPMLEPSSVQVPAVPPAEVTPSRSPAVSVPSLDVPSLNAPNLDAAPPGSTPPPASPQIAAAEPQPILPPAILPNQQPVTVTVPPLQPSAATEPATEPASPSATPQTETVRVPPLSPNATPDSNPTPELTSRQAIEFGQPRALSRTSSQNAGSAAPVLLPSGTVLSLRYPRQTSLELSGAPRQEVLVLQQAVRDRSGNILIPEGSQVLGRFETGSDGSQFVAQAITLQGRNVRLNAESEILGGDRQVSQRNLIGSSALGALALGVVGGFTGVGLLGGALVGAATTYLTSPQPATIQPNQVVEVRLLEDWLQWSATGLRPSTQ